MSSTAAAATAVAFLALTLASASASDLPGDLKRIDPTPLGEYIEIFVEGDDSVVSYEAAPDAAGLMVIGIFTYDEPQCSRSEEYLAELRRMGAAYAGEVVYDDDTFGAFIYDTTLYDRPVILTSYNKGELSCVTNIMLIERD